MTKCLTMNVHKDALGLRNKVGSGPGLDPHHCQVPPMPGRVTLAACSSRWAQMVSPNTTPLGEPKVAGGQVVGTALQGGPKQAGPGTAAPQGEAPIIMGLGLRRCNDPPKATCPARIPPCPLVPWPGAGTSSQHPPNLSAKYIPWAVPPQLPTPARAVPSDTFQTD